MLNCVISRAGMVILALLITSTTQAVACDPLQSDGSIVYDITDPLCLAEVRGLAAESKDGASEETIKWITAANVAMDKWRAEQPNRKIHKVVTFEKSVDTTGDTRIVSTQNW